MARRGGLSFHGELGEVSVVMDSSRQGRFAYTQVPLGARLMVDAPEEMAPFRAVALGPL